jgi:hypothetical protein
MTEPDNTEPWQRVARELGTFEPATDPDRDAPYDWFGYWTPAEPVCREIARLRHEVERLLLGRPE